MNFIKAITRDGETELFNADNILTIQPSKNGTTKILMGAGLYWWVKSDSIEWVNCYNDLAAAIKEEPEEAEENFEIVKSEFDYTGGGCWVLSSEIWLYDERETIFATVDNYNCFFYDNRDDFDNFENAIYGVYFEHIEEAAPKYRDIARTLFSQFDDELVKVEGE